MVVKDSWLHIVTAALQGRGKIVFRAFALVLAFVLLFSFFPPHVQTSNYVPKFQSWSPQLQKDMLDHFFKSQTCSISSTDLFKPSAGTVCSERSNLLAAMSGGGRIGVDAPYQTRDCDMRWFSTSEICEIMSRFDHVWILGDSMMRHLTQGLMILLREDMVMGGRATWRDDNPPGLDCREREVLNSECGFDFGALNSTLVKELDAGSWRCGDVDPRISFHWFAKTPLDESDIQEWNSQITNTANPDGRQAFIFGMGGWNDFESSDTIKCMLQLEAAMKTHMPAFFREKNAELFPRLFISPNAQGEGKNQFFVRGGQNNIQLMKFVHEMEAWTQLNGYEHLGLFNMTVQASSPDGTHASLENNLLKAMMALNWLAAL